MKAEGLKKRKLLKKRLRRRLNKSALTLESAAQKLRQKGVDVNVEMLYGEPAGEIVTYARAGQEVWT